MNTDPSVRLTLPRLVAAEWLKLRTLRSSWVPAIAAPVLAVGGAVPAALALADPASNEGLTAREAVDGVLSSSAGVLQIAVVVLAVFALSSEYTGGALRVTLLTVPRRWSLIAAKAAVVAVAVSVLAGVSLILGYAAALPLLHRGGTAVEPYGTMQLALFGTEIGYCVLVALFASAVTLAFRSATAGIGVTLGVVLLLDLVLLMLDPARILGLQGLAFSTAATGFLTDPLSRSLPVVVAWLVIPAVAGGLRLTRRDT